ncbi:MAG: hypothetical protein J0I41_10950 [Filimonas sp.]|nr:hypothetical protein [Filimonas sp.]
MGDKSFYRPKIGAILYSLSEIDFQLLEKHKNMKRISIWLEGLAINDLEFLLKRKHLEEVIIYGGKVGDYSALAGLPKLKSLFLNGYLRRWLEHFDFLSEIYSLEKLSILHYPMFTQFPNLQNLVNLKNISIDGCKRLTDISNVALLPNLKNFGIISTPQTVEDLEFIAQRKGMKQMSGAFGSKQKDESFERMLEKYGLVYG